MNRCFIVFLFFSFLSPLSSFSPLLRACCSSHRSLHSRLAPANAAKEEEEEEEEEEAQDGARLHSKGERTFQRDLEEPGEFGVRGEAFAGLELSTLGVADAVGAVDEGLE